MTQVSRPQQDITRVGWEEDDGATGALFDQINELVAADASYLRTGPAPAGVGLRAKLSPLTAPAVRTGHVTRCRIKKDAARGSAITFLAELRQGYVSEGALGTLIHATTLFGIGGTEWVTVEMPLSEASANAISDYGDLASRLVGTQV